MSAAEFEVRGEGLKAKVTVSENDDGSVGIKIHVPGFGVCDDDHKVVENWDNVSLYIESRKLRGVMASGDDESSEYVFQEYEPGLTVAEADNWLNWGPAKRHNNLYLMNHPESAAGPSFRQLLSKASEMLQFDAATGQLLNDTEVFKALDVTCQFLIQRICDIVILDRASTLSPSYLERCKHGFINPFWHVTNLYREGSGFCYVRRALRLNPDYRKRRNCDEAETQESFNEALLWRPESASPLNMTDSEMRKAIIEASISEPLLILPKQSPNDLELLTLLVQVPIPKPAEITKITGIEHRGRIQRLWISYNLNKFCRVFSYIEQCSIGAISMSWHNSAAHRYDAVTIALRLISQAIKNPDDEAVRREIDEFVQWSPTTPQPNVMDMVLALHAYSAETGRRFLGRDDLIKLLGVGDNDDVEQVWITYCLSVLVPGYLDKCKSGDINPDWHNTDNYFPHMVEIVTGLTERIWSGTGDVEGAKAELIKMAASTSEATASEVILKAYEGLTITEVIDENQLSHPVVDADDYEKKVRSLQESIVSGMISKGKDEEIGLLVDIFDSHLENRNRGLSRPESEEYPAEIAAHGMKWKIQVKSVKGGTLVTFSSHLHSGYVVQRDTVRDAILVFQGLPLSAMRIDMTEVTVSGIDWTLYCRTDNGFQDSARQRVLAVSGDVSEFMYGSSMHELVSGFTKARADNEHIWTEYVVFTEDGSHHITLVERVTLDDQVRPKDLPKVKNHYSFFQRGGSQVILASQVGMRVSGDGVTCFMKWLEMSKVPSYTSTDSADVVDVTIGDETYKLTKVVYSSVGCGYKVSCAGKDGNVMVVTASGMYDAIDTLVMYTDASASLLQVTFRGETITISRVYAANGARLLGTCSWSGHAEMYPLAHGLADAASRVALDFLSKY